MIISHKDMRIKRLLYCSCYTGMRETDILLGNFVRHHISDLSESQLDMFETLLSYDDGIIFSWITGGEGLPANLNPQMTMLIRQIASHVSTDNINRL